MIAFLILSFEVVLSAVKALAGLDAVWCVVRGVG
jgi:hypothetical protein